MFRIVKKIPLNPTVTEMYIEAPLVAAKALPGQFIILRVDPDGERIPLTVAGCDKKAGTVRIIFQIVGATTEKLNHKKAGDFLQDFAGPLGRPTRTEGLHRVCIVTTDARSLLLSGSAPRICSSLRTSSVQPPNASSS